MFTAIGGVLFAFLVAFVLYYYSMVLLDELWNSKGAIKAREQAVEALLRLEKFLHDIEEKEV